MSNFRDILRAKVNLTIAQSERLGVAEIIEPRLFAFVSRSVQDSRLAMETYSEIWRFLDQIALGLDAIHEIGGGLNVRPRAALIRRIHDNTLHIYDWSLVMSAWVAPSVHVQDENPYAPFTMGGSAFMLADAEKRIQVRRVMGTHYNVHNSLTHIFEVKRFDGTKWTVEMDEEFVLKVLKVCTIQGQRPQLRMPWTDVRHNGLIQLGVSSQNNIRTIVAHTGAERLDLQILGVDRHSFGMRFTLEPVALKAVEPTDPTDGDNCNICLSYLCGCSPPHTPAVPGCGNLIHHCCFVKHVEFQRERGRNNTNCLYCTRRIDMATFPQK